MYGKDDTSLRIPRYDIDLLQRLYMPLYAFIPLSDNVDEKRNFIRVLIKFNHKGTPEIRKRTV